MNECYEIRIERVVSHPSGYDHRSPQMVINAELTDLAVAKIMAAITNEITKLAGEK